nr:MAG TPA: hypothetical protein [Caudoviricetes sp.]
MVILIPFLIPPSKVFLYTIKGERVVIIHQALRH